MNNQKLQLDLIKDLQKYPDAKDYKRTFIGLAHYNDFIAVLTQHCIYFIHENDFYLDYKKVVDQLQDFTHNINSILFDLKEPDIKEAVKTDITIEQGKNRILNVFEAENVNVCINKKLISYYNKDNYIYKVISYKKPLLIYNLNNELIGYILPVNLNYSKNSVPAAN